MKDYKKILEGVMNIINTTEKSDIGFANICVYIFENCPELKGSEDEIARRGLLEWLKKKRNNTTIPFSIREADSWIAWLEKQGDKKDNLSVDFVLGYLGIKPAYKDGNAWCILLGDNIQEGICGFGDTKEEALIAFMKELIEKQDEKKPANNVIETWKDMRLEVYQQASGNRHEPNYSDDTTKIFSLNDIDEIIEKINEKKSIDKVEPKFKVGDWIIFDENHNSVYQIERIDNYRYYLRHYLGGTMSVHFDNKLIRHWTIQDAKAGDVLEFRTYKNCVCIFKKIKKDEDGETSVFAYCGLELGDFCIPNEGQPFCAPEDLVPATKEQREQLEKAIADAGYVWFPGEKELKKIEQKPAEWSEEDEALREKVINTIWAYANMPHCGINFEAANELECWLKSIRPLPKQEWSEEDEKIRKELLVHCQKFSEASNAIKLADEYAKYNSWVAWLKSLRPQKQWKPSDAQMNALETAVSSLPLSALESLYNKLKKLREE